MTTVREDVRPHPDTVSEVSRGQHRRARRSRAEPGASGGRSSRVRAWQVHPVVMATAWELVESHGYTRLVLESPTSVLVR